MKNYLDGNTLYIEVTQDEVIKPIINTAQTVHIHGNGNTLTINTVSPYGVAIGAEVWTVSGGRYSINNKCKLNTLIIDNVNVIVNETNPCFSLGTYNSQNSVEIKCINGGSISCPEARGISYLLYKAEEPEASTKYYQYPKYVLVDSINDVTFCEEQIEVFGKDYEKYSKIYPTSFRPRTLRFLIEHNIIPRPEFFDKDIPSYYLSLLSASLKLGCDPLIVWEVYTRNSYRDSTLWMELMLKPLMYDAVCPDCEQVPGMTDNLNAGYIGELFKLANKAVPIVTEDNVKVYRYLLPVDDYDVSIEHVRNCLAMTADSRKSHFEELIDKALQGKFTDSYELSLLGTDGNIYIRSAVELNNKEGRIFVYDKARQKLVMFDYPSVTRPMVKMMGGIPVTEELKVSLETDTPILKILGRDYKGEFINE